MICGLTQTAANKTVVIILFTVYRNKSENLSNSEIQLITLKGREIKNFK